MEEVLEKPPLNGVTCIAWILTANFDLVGQQAWKAFFAGQGGVRDAFLGLSETLAGARSALLLSTMCHPQCSTHHVPQHA